MKVDVVDFDFPSAFSLQPKQPKKGVSMLKKTAHFDQRWWEEIGKPPSTAEVNLWIRKHCILIQKYKELFTARGRRCDLMALYWYPRKEVIFKVDERRGRIVTVLTEYTLRNTYRQSESVHDSMPFIRHLTNGRYPQSPEDFNNFREGKL